MVKQRPSVRGEGLQNGKKTTSNAIPGHTVCCHCCQCDWFNSVEQSWQLNHLPLRTLLGYLPINLKRLKATQTILLTAYLLARVSQSSF
jgi:hypothetical protein